MLLRISKLLLVMALTLSLGLHWMFLQTVAWTGMMVKYSQTVTVEQAINWTFDGSHACKLCKLVQEGSKSRTNKTAEQAPVLKVKCLPPISLVFLRPSELSVPSRVPFALLPLRTDAPALPPPRSFFA